MSRHTTTRAIVAAIRRTERMLDRVTALAVDCQNISPDSRAWKSILEAGDLLNRARLDLQYPKID